MYEDCIALHGAALAEQGLVCILHLFRPVKSGGHFVKQSYEHQHPSSKLSQYVQRRNLFLELSRDLTWLSMQPRHKQYQLRSYYLPITERFHDHHKVQ